MKTDITASELRDLLFYDCETGVFTWNKARGPLKVGKLAGSRDAYGYWTIGIKGSYYKAHRLAWLYHYGEWPEKDLDHINGIPDDNRICNLRKASRSENCRNQSKRVNNTSGYKGVSWCKRDKKWSVQISNNGKRIRLGYFDSVIDAAEAYENAARELHGEFARTISDDVQYRVTISFGDDGSCNVTSWGSTPERAKQAELWASKRHNDIVAGFMKEPKDEDVKPDRCPDTEEMFA
jgi:hypothetical protein